MKEEHAKEIKDAIDNDIETNVGLMAYRKYLWALKFIQEDIKSYEEYLTEVSLPIENKIGSLQTQEKFLRQKIEDALRVDPAVKKTKTGGRTINLPDVGIATLQADKDKYEYTDEEALLEQLGEDFQKVKPTLDKVALKEFIKTKCTVKDGKVIVEETGEILKGISVEKTNTFTLKLN